MAEGKDRGKNGFLNRGKINERKPFTIRLDAEIFDKLELLGEQNNLSKAKVASSYLQLCNVAITKSSLNLETYDGIKLSLLPRDILGLLFENQSSDAQFKIGDNLGLSVETNCRILEYHSLDQKMSYLEQLGWFEIMPIAKTENGHDKSIKYYGISTKFWPINIVHALLYRMLYMKKIPEDWTIEILKAYLPMSDEELKREAASKNVKNNPQLRNLQKRIQDYKTELGGIIENFAPDCSYYIFEILRIP